MNMKIYLSYIFIVFFINTSILKAQKVDHIRVLTLLDDSAVEYYFDSLSTTTGKNIQVTKKVDDQGNLMLWFFFDANDLDIFHCTLVITKYTRIKGREICTSQIIISDTKNIVSNLNFVKDNFRKTNVNKWNNKKDDSLYFTEAEFQTDDDGASIKYRLIVEKN
jgi:hypothetical protein